MHLNARRSHLQCLLPIPHNKIKIMYYSTKIPTFRSLQSHGIHLQRQDQLYETSARGVPLPPANKFINASLHGGGDGGREHLKIAKINLTGEGVEATT